MVLVCGPLLGYGIADALIKKGAPLFIMPLLVGVGSILALVQTFRTVKLLSEPEEKHDRESRDRRTSGS